ncbi:MAG: aminodeoxychorismate/anthranilate synthase component II [Deltaproteobacteria bacterium]|nr:MAG: aminodeoxychorismate/anthranilate synthase component II [Deltaproteobacteria bacterium]
MKPILVLDNYDSFTYNLVHLLFQIGVKDVDVIRNDKISAEEAQAYEKILLSPGPGIPSEAGNMPAIIEACAPSSSILGICLGHQAIAEAFGGSLLQMETVMHGRETPIHIVRPDEPLFAGLNSTVQVGRYHSWLVRRDDLPDCFTVTAEDDSNSIMGISHNSLDVRGVQFHPESVMTSTGEQMLRNWLSL